MCHIPSSESSAIYTSCSIYLVKLYITFPCIIGLLRADQLLLVVLINGYWIVIDCIRIQQVKRLLVTIQHIKKMGHLYTTSACCAVIKPSSEAFYSTSCQNQDTGIARPCMWWSMSVPMLLDQLQFTSFEHTQTMPVTGLEHLFVIHNYLWTLIVRMSIFSLLSQQSGVKIIQLEMCLLWEIFVFQTWGYKYTKRTHFRGRNHTFAHANTYSCLQNCLVVHNKLRRMNEQ